MQLLSFALRWLQTHIGWPMGECAEEGFHFLLNSSAYPDTLRWSEDNQLVVGGKYESILLNSTNFTAPKGVAGFLVKSHIAYAVDAVP